MIKVIRIYDDEVKGILQQFQFYDKFMYGDSSKKSFIEKFFKAYYGIEEGLDRLEKFYDSTESFFGDNKTYFNIAIKDDCINLNKFMNFFSKVYPTLKLEISSTTELPRIKSIKFRFASIMYENLEFGSTCDLDVSLETFLTSEEFDELLDTRDMFENGYKYRMKQYECSVCKEYDFSHPIHLEIDPFA